MDFWLVQRIKKRAGIGQTVKASKQLYLDYMGASEFEFGAIPKALKTMKAHSCVQTSIEVLIFDQIITFHVIGIKSEIQTLESRFQKWIDDGLRGHEDPQLDRVITKKWYNGELISEERESDLPVAWWSIRDNIFWSLDPKITQIWLDQVLCVPNPVISRPYF